MSFGFAAAAALAMVVAILAMAFELYRTQARRFDTFTIFLVIFYLQCLAPAIVILSCLAFFCEEKLTLGNVFFDRVYEAVNAEHAMLVAGFMAVFLVFTFLIYRVLVAESVSHPIYRLKIDAPALRLVAILGLLSGAALLLMLGGSLGEGYRALVRFRNSDAEIARSFVTANLFSLTQTFLLVGFLGLFIARHWKLISPRFFSWAAVVAIFAVLCVSRRSLLIPALLFGFTLLLAGRLPKWSHVVVLGLIGLGVLYGGKPVLSYLAGDTRAVALPTRAPVENALYVASDLGITVTESLGTVALLDLPPRWGVDHLWSLLRRVPEGAFGFEDPFPERIVRQSTAVFMGPDDQDIPPGFMGMMWLDFRWVGPLIYAAFFGVGLALIERVRRRCEIDLQSSAVFALALFVFCLPINTGSLDFTFSVDMIMLTLFVLFVLRVERVENQPAGGGTASS